MDIDPELLNLISEAGWVPTKEIGSGGGGTVYRCVKVNLIRATEPFMPHSAPIGISGDSTLHAASKIDELFQILNAGDQGIAALKVPHDIDDANTRNRMKREIQGMASVAHPALINLIDFDRSENPRWFVMDYYHGGVLTDNVSNYHGNPLAVLRAVRPIAEGLSRLHGRKLVHRDIKPGNIFITSDGKLILGDFGIIFTKEDDRTRLTNPEDLPFSRDWIPDWVRFRKIEDFPENSDIFMLAKVMYFMVSGGKKVLSTQIGETDFNLVKLFPESSGINLIYNFLVQCITNTEAECRFKTADSFLHRVDELIRDITRDPVPQLLFNVFQPKYPNQFPIPKAGPKVFKEILSSVVFIPNGYRNFRGRARVGNSSNTLETGAVRFALGTHPDRKVSVGANILGEIQDDWTAELGLNLPEGLPQDWYTVALEGYSSNEGLYLTDFNLYGA